MNPNPNLEIVTIFESDDLIAFQLATAALEDAGIEFTVSVDAPPGFGFSPMLSQMRRIMIPAYRMEEALQLIEGEQQEEDRSDINGDSTA